MDLFIALAIGISLVATVIFVHASVLRLIRLEQASATPVMTRVVASLFAAHVAEVAIFAMGMYIAAEFLNIGALTGIVDSGFRSYMYYSMATYTSLGLGDIYPSGELRLLTGFEVLTGLLMIGWSASFLFVEMRAAADRKLQ